MNRRPPDPRQRGAFAVEFGLVFMVFLIMVLGIIEVSRALYMWNTLQEVTRRAARAASTTDFSDQAAINQLRRAATFSDSGNLPLGAPVTDKHLIVDYLSLQNNAGVTTAVPIPAANMPACPARNRLTCTANANSPSCIRFVRVRVCEPGTDCSQVPYKMMVPLLDLSIGLPTSTTIMRAESLGYTPGMPMCN
jgi:Flp pilus assembly protein TadG